MRLTDEVESALADLAAADDQARANLAVSKQTVLQAMDAAARLAKHARALPDLPADQRDRLWQILENPYMRLAIDSGPFSVDPPDSERGEATSQIVTPNGGRFDAAGFIRRLHSDWRDILDDD
jgi:hypothetical protein